jgi:hypothetical protein
MQAEVAAHLQEGHGAHEALQTAVGVRKLTALPPHRLAENPGLAVKSQPAAAVRPHIFKINQKGAHRGAFLMCNISAYKNANRGLAKLPRLGNTCCNWAADAPNQPSNVAAY